MQSENLIDIQRVGSDEQLVASVPSARFEPCDVFVASDVGVFAVDALASPVGDPVRRAC